MRINVQQLNIHPADRTDSRVEQRIAALGRTRQIDEANIRLVRILNDSPAYQVKVHLITPGPDVFAETRDHTLRAAVDKAVAALEEQITTRAARRLRRIKSNLKSRRAG